MIYENILTKEQSSVIRKVKSLPKDSYLAGGTALALQLGHRTSLDFDFYTKNRFDSEKVLRDLRQDFDRVEIRQAAKDTLLLDIEGISFSLFYYPYNLISPSKRLRNVTLASLKDIAAMKMIAISARGKRRDFIDSYYLLNEFSLKEILKFTSEKYPGYQPMVILKGLVYLKDAEDEDLSRGIKILDKNFSWEKAKEKIFQEVKKYQFSMIGK